MDNQQFLVNGRHKEDLLLALQLLFNLHGRPYTNPKSCVAGWRADSKFGFVLYWHVDEHLVKQGANRFPIKLSEHAVLPMIWEWLHTSEDVKNFNFSNRWEQDYDDGDVSTELGWTVYVEEWGHVDGNSYAIGAVRPSWCWYGK